MRSITPALLLVLLAGPASAQDDHSNIRSGAATLVTADGASVAGTIEVGGDRDWFRFTLQGGTPYTISTSALGAGMDTVLNVYTPQGARVAEDDNGGGGLASRVTFTPASAGTYYARVIHAATSGTGTYAIGVATGAPPPPPPPPPPADDHPNIRSSAATLITAGAAATAGRIEVPGDRDWFRFALQAGARYTVATSALGAGMDTLLDVYTPQGARVGSDDNGGGGLASSVTFTPATAGTYYARVIHASTAGTGTYALGVASAGVPASLPAGSALVFVSQPATSVAGAPLHAVGVEVRDAAGRLLTATPTVTVALAGNPARGQLRGTLTAVAVNGLATFRDLSIDLAGTGYSLGATANGATGAISAAFKVEAAAASRLEFAGQPGPVAAGSLMSPVTVRVLDRFGNLVNTAPSSVTASLAPNAAGAVLGGSLTAAAGSGLATFADLRLDRPGTGLVLTATRGALSVSSTPFDVSDGVPVGLAFVSLPREVESRALMLPQVQVRVVDAAGNTVTTPYTGVQLALAPNTAGAALSGLTGELTARSGVATFTDLRIVAPDGAYSLLASAANLTTATSPSFAVVPIVAPALLRATPQDGTRVRLVVRVSSRTTAAIDVQRRPSGAGTFVTVASDPGAAQWGFVDDPTAVPETSYDYRVVGGTANGTSSPPSDVVSVTTGPLSPAALDATARGRTRVDLTWNDRSGMNVAYVVERCLAGTGQFAPLGPPLHGDATAMSDTTCAAGTSYDYRVVAHDAAGLVSSPSNVATASTTPDAPANVWAAGGVGCVVVSWDDVVGATSYTLYRGSSSGVSPTSPGVVVSHGVTSPVYLEGLTPGAAAHFVVTATSPGGTSAASTMVQAVPSSAPAPSAVSAHALNVTLGQLEDVIVDRLRRRAFVLDSTTDELVAIDLTTEAVVARLPLSSGARSVSLSPNGRHLVVVCAPQGFSAYRGVGAERGVLHVVDPQALVVTASHAIAVDPFDVVVLDRGACYVPSGSNQWTEIHVVDAQTGASLGLLHMVRMMSHVTLSPDQRRIYSIDVDADPFVLRSWDLATGLATSQWDTRGRDPLTVNADGTRGLTTAGELLELTPGGGAGQDVRPLFRFPRALVAPAAAPAPRYIDGFDPATGELLRFDVVGLTVARFPGYDRAALGAPRLARLTPLRNAVIVVTSEQRLVIVPLP